jgi:hypothetical protein
MENLTVNESYHTQKGQQLLTVFINMLYIVAMRYLYRGTQSLGNPSICLLVLHNKINEHYMADLSG